MSEKIVIHGNRALSGTVKISGAKNSVLKLMAGALLSKHPVALHNTPALSDVTVMADVLRHLGCTVTLSPGVVSIDASGANSIDAPYELVSKMRASFNVLGSLLGRFKEARVALPGGCSIGKRNVDLHVKGLTALGADVEIIHGYVEAKASRLVGAEILLDTPSVGATENIMLAAVFAEGTTVLSNAAQEPEITDLANFLNAIGADVNGAGTNEIIIHGVSPSAMRETSYTVMPDRIEAATYIIAAAATRGSLVVQDIIPAHLNSLTHKLLDMGVSIESISPNSLKVSSNKRLQAQNIVTQPYPGFPTDLQAPLMALLCVSDGVSIVKETIYESRFKQVAELIRMGANVSEERNVAIVNGIETLSGAEVQAHDLRAGASMIIAGLQAKGCTEIRNIHHIDRGYEYVVDKLSSLGADIRRAKDDALTDLPTPDMQTAIVSNNPQANPDSNV
ncbi:MAG: UDP-N-acetylglucosamine 1-carboxyvinyltransferase [Cyanobacteria bacterium P01_H01_bin.74]